MAMVILKIGNKVLEFITDMKKKQTYSFNLIFSKEKEQTVCTLKERMSNLDSLINGLEKDYSNFSYEVDLIKDSKTLQQNRKENETENYDQLREFILNYDENNHLLQTPEEFEDFINDIWNNHELHSPTKQQKSSKHNTNNKHSKNNTNSSWEIKVLENKQIQNSEREKKKMVFYIEALEVALNDTKIQKAKEIERLNAKLEDYEG